MINLVAIKAKQNNLNQELVCKLYFLIKNKEKHLED